MTLLFVQPGYAATANGTTVYVTLPEPKIARKIDQRWRYVGKAEGEGIVTMPLPKTRLHAGQTMEFKREEDGGIWVRLKPISRKRKSRDRAPKQPPASRA